MARRTLFVTYTFRPRGSSWVPNDKECWPEIKRLLDALRKEQKFRYLAVQEIGKKGRFHYHVLMHGDFTTRRVRNLWKQGITHARVCKPHHPAYVCKYIAKSGLRPRASTGYGRTAIHGALDRYEDYFRALDAAFGGRPCRIDKMSIHGVKMPRDLIPAETPVNLPYLNHADATLARIDGRSHSCEPTDPTLGEREAQSLRQQRGISDGEALPDGGQSESEGGPVA